MITGDATVVGAAAIEIYPVTTGFQERVKEQTDPRSAVSRRTPRRPARSRARSSKRVLERDRAGSRRPSPASGCRSGTSAVTCRRPRTVSPSVDSKGKGLVGTLSTVGGGTLAAATVGVVGFGIAGVKAATSFEAATTSIAANANISVAAAKKISDAFLNTAGHTIYSAQQIATAYAGVAGVLGALNGKALTAAQSQKFMAAAMDLAEASGVQLGAATEAIAKTMQAYHLQVAQAPGDGHPVQRVSRDRDGPGTGHCGALADEEQTRRPRAVALRIGWAARRAREGRCGRAHLRSR